MGRWCQWCGWRSLADEVSAVADVTELLREACHVARYADVAADGVVEVRREHARVGVGDVAREPAARERSSGQPEPQTAPATKRARLPDCSATLEGPQILYE